jgi:hypothetical protein
LLSLPTRLSACVEIRPESRLARWRDMVDVSSMNHSRLKQVLV